MFTANLNTYQARQDELLKPAQNGGLRNSVKEIRSLLTNLGEVINNILKGSREEMVGLSLTPYFLSR
jgi:hypothetical protein